MLLYLSSHTHPHIAFAVHQSASYTFKPTNIILLLLNALVII
ncbi:hypothetical protein ACHAW6_000574 [Cyclotella cf. meneghiniana]